MRSDKQPGLLPMNLAVETPSLQRTELFVAVDDDHRIRIAFGKSLCKGACQLVLAIAQRYCTDIVTSGHEGWLERLKQSRFPAAVWPDDCSPTVLSRERRNQRLVIYVAYEAKWNGAGPRPARP